MTSRTAETSSTTEHQWTLNSEHQPARHQNITVRYSLCSATGETSILFHAPHKETWLEAKAAKAEVKSKVVMTAHAYGKAWPKQAGFIMVHHHRQEQGQPIRAQENWFQSSSSSSSSSSSYAFSDCIFGRGNQHGVNKAKEIVAFHRDHENSNREKFVQPNIPNYAVYLLYHHPLNALLHETCASKWRTVPHCKSNPSLVPPVPSRFR